MQVWIFLFWLSCFLVFYNYAGYALLVYLFNRLTKKRVAKAQDHQPSVSFIVAAYNEEDCMEKKILNSLEQHYPSEKIEFLFITDGSTDGTNEVIRRHPQVRLLFEPLRKGKSAALNRAVSMASHDILIFSDANTILNPDATAQIAGHYADEWVGGVAGEKKVIAAGAHNDQVGAGEGLYWKYESTLKQLDSDFYSVVGAAGELFSLRRNLYEPVADDVILDDFLISMKVTEKGYRVRYEPHAYAMELPSFSLKDEQKRKVRIAAGGFQAMSLLGSIFKFWKHPQLTFLYISHRVMRWTLSPICLVMALVSNIMLVLGDSAFIYDILLAFQCCFYLMALIAAVYPSQHKIFKLFRLAYYFVFMNLSVVQGFFRFLRGRQPAAWEKARRSQGTVDSIRTESNHK